MEYKIEWPMVMPSKITLELSFDEFSIIVRRMTEHTPEDNKTADLAHVLKSALNTISPFGKK